MTPENRAGHGEPPERDDPPDVGDSESGLAIGGLADGPLDAPLRVQVPALLDGVRVDRAVALLTGVSRSAAAVLVAEGRVRLGGRPVTTGSRTLAEADVLEVERRGASASGAIAEPEVDVTVVYEDAEVVVVDKPAGLVVHPGAGHQRHTLVGGLLARYPDLAQLVRQGMCDPDRPGIVQRLDRGTSGLLVVARTPGAYRSLVAQLGARSVERRYLALVQGLVVEDRGAVEAPIGRSARTPTRMAVSAQGKPARTRYTVLARYDLPLPSTLLALALDTGRTHQIRVHLAAVGHPVAGDDRYGSIRPEHEGLGLEPGRLFLHAWRLGFEHPGTGDRVRWTSPLPAELASVLPEVPDLLGDGADWVELP